MQLIHFTGLHVSQLEFCFLICRQDFIQLYFRLCVCVYGPLSPGFATPVDCMSHPAGNTEGGRSVADGAAVLVWHAGACGNNYHTASKLRIIVLTQGVWQTSRVYLKGNLLGVHSLLKSAFSSFLLPLPWTELVLLCQSDISTYRISRLCVPDRRANISNKKIKTIIY